MRLPSASNEKFIALFELSFTSIYASPVVDIAGHACVDTEGGTFHNVALDGDSLWTFQTEDALEGRTFPGSFDEKFYRLNAKGFLEGVIAVRGG